MADCVFCRIVAGDDPAHRLVEGGSALAFLDASPATRGHALVVPKPHRETLQAMEPELVDAVFRMARDVARAVQAAFDADGVTLHQSNGTVAGQDVPHAHVHVVPRYEGDDVTVRWRAGNPSETDARCVRDAIRTEL